MGKIKQLPLYEAQKIAAGEVVERPANVLKELLENALDAQATHISVYIEEGGKKLIKVVDNGTGMSYEDAHMCVKHHATSKINTVNDLSTVTTFGFRGEALSSIASVSTLTITTKQACDSLGTELIFSDNILKQEKSVSCNTGTIISVEDIFYNIPARKKFLKGTQTEWRAINQLFHAFCLDYINVNFKLYNNNKLVINCPSTDDLKIRITQLYDPDFAKHTLMLNTQSSTFNLTVTGAITDTHFYRYDRNQIFLFVNHRWVKNYKLSQALIKGYHNILQPRKYPAAFIFISIDTHQVDINIHPRKEEVQFLNPRTVEKFIEDTVYDRLNSYHTEKLAPSNNNRADYTSLFNDQNATSLNLDNKDEISIRSLHSPQNNIHYQSPEPQDNSSSDPVNRNEEKNFLNVLEHYFKSSPENFNTNTSPLQENSNTTKKSDNQLSNTSNEVEQKSILNTSINAEITTLNNKDPHSSLFIKPDISYTIIGQLFKTYIMIENEANLILIDQHAAHERIIYERLRTQFESIPTIKLLFATTVSVTTGDMELFNEHKELLESGGIFAEQMSPTQIIISETPAILKNQSLEKIIKQFIAWIHESQKIDKKAFSKLITEKLHAEMSCKAAVKAGDILTIEAMKEIVDALYKTNNKLTCPHGRPTLWTVTQSEIEKKFKRDYR